jgi:hypothetical protein
MKRRGGQISYLVWKSLGQTVAQFGTPTHNNKLAQRLQTITNSLSMTYIPLVHKKDEVILTDVFTCRYQHHLSPRLGIYRLWPKFLFLAPVTFSLHE